MTGLCGVTGCANSVTTKCYWCSLPLCAEHAVALETEDGQVVCCRGCAAYLTARSSGAEERRPGGAHAE